MLKRLLSIFVAVSMVTLPVLVEGKGYRSYHGKSPYQSRSSIYKANKSSRYSTSYRDNTHKPQKYSTHPKSTYKIWNTKNTYSGRYKNSGLPGVKRSESAKREFLKSKGYKRVPPGYEVDHIIPLSKGGRDGPSNMQLIPKNLHRQKTADERRR